MYQAPAAILDRRLCLPLTVRIAYLRDRLKADRASAAKLSKARRRIGESIDETQGIQLIDCKPQLPIPSPKLKVWKIASRIQVLMMSRSAAICSA